MSVVQGTKFVRSIRGAGIRVAASLHSAAAGGQPQTPFLPSGLFKWWLETEMSVMDVKNKYILFCQ